ncbi:helix-turn-helix domain-containing protein [Methylophilus glucosoxydans]|uniref:Helix-turn-helix domain-containing protein n=1 Tax=Methylophilus glucosoxydans TaxID=752553 RepID=A0ABW3GEU8_9PROT|nr:helix-turn-helix domain-containing protein [Methylophilus sp. 13]MBF5040181.1 helix-turn-helix domain-containing protein [Methylophilus sp. 13]
MLSETQKFDDIVFHAAALNGWSQHYDQLTPGEFRGFLQDVQLPSMRIFREYMNCSVVQHTMAPKNTFNLIIPIRGTQDTKLSNHTLRPDCFTLIPSSAEFFLCTQGETDYVVISLDESFLEKMLVPEDFDTFLKYPKGYSLRCDESALCALQSLCKHVLDDRTPDLAGNLKGRVQALFRDEVINYLLQGMDVAGQRSRIRNLESNHHYLVRYCHDRILNEKGQISILTLCNELRIPRRTLAYAFERVTGVSPNNYLRAVRLNAADRGLRDSPDWALTDIAHHYGFTHSSHFGREYRKLFGKRPSDHRKW